MEKDFKARGRQRLPIGNEGNFQMKEGFRVAIISTGSPEDEDNTDIKDKLPYDNFEFFKIIKTLNQQNEHTGTSEAGVFKYNFEVANAFMDQYL